MSLNLIDAAKGLFTNELMSKASSYFGESETGVSKAISGILPTVLSGLSSKTATTDGANAVSQMVNDQHSSGILGNLGSFFGNDSGSLLNKGAGLLGGIFGNNTSGITSLLSNFSGLKSASTTGLLSMALPAVLGLIGKHSSGGASGIASLLSSQKDNIAAAVPSGLNLSSVLGGTTSTVSNMASSVKSTASNVVDDVEESTGGAMRYLLPLLLLIAAAIGAYYLFVKGCNKPAEPVVVKDTAVVATPPVADVMPTHTLTKVKLADGSFIDAYKGGIEDQLVAFLDNKSLAVDTAKGNWFDFDNLNFKLGKSDITDSSMVQVKNLMAILKAYPAAKFRIGGYTDSSGNPEANLKLSQARAGAVKTAIVAAGANAAQLAEAKGYGSQFAKESPKASDEARKKDRRTAVRVMAK